jgi:hypothetical protein
VRARLFLLCVVPVLAGCGSEDRPAPVKRGVLDTTCAQITTLKDARRIAFRIDHMVVAPDGQSRRETVGILAKSLEATCSQDNPGYKPVAPVLKVVQAEFDHH